MPDSAGGKWLYECRACKSILFRVAWYTAPVRRDGNPEPPGWALECGGCGRATLMPEAPDLTEARTV